MPISSNSGARRYRNTALLFGAFTLSAAVISGCNSAKPVASVNGTTLSQEEFAKMCESSTTVQPQSGGSVGLQMLRQWILSTVTAQVAKDQNVYPSEQELNAGMETTRKRVSRPGTTLEELIANQGTTLDAVKREELNNLVSLKVMTRGVTVTDDEVRKAFDSQKAAMTQPEQVEISTITVDSEKAKSDTQADLNANSVFQNVATSRSKDPFRQNGGKVPTPLPAKVPPQLQGQVPQEVVDAAFKLKPGQVSEPVKVGQTWVFVRLDNKIAKKEPDFNEFKEPIRDQLLQQKAQQTGKLQENQKAVIDALKKAKIEIGPPQYQVLAKALAQSASAPSAPGGGAAGGAPGEGEAPPMPPGR